MVTKKGTASGARTKTDRNPATVDEYIDRVQEPGRTVIAKMRTAIRSVFPAEAEETISYGVPVFKSKKVSVWYAAFQNHCSLFPGAAIIASFKDELKDYTTSKGTIQFPISKPLPTALIKRLVKARFKLEHDDR